MSMVILGSSFEQMKNKHYLLDTTSKVKVDINSSSVQNIKKIP